MREALKALNQRPISYYPINTKIMGSITGGVALSQIMYWFTAGKNPPLKIYKTDAELQDETHLSDNEMRAVKKKLKAISFLTVSREGVPAKTFYAIDWDEYYSSLVKFTKQECNDDSLVETNSTDCGNSPSKISEIHETITESTQRLPESTSPVAGKPDDDLPQAFTETMLEAIDVATHLSTKLSESIDNYKQPSIAGLHKWAKDIDLAIRKDDRTKSQLIEAINWIHDGAGSFWIGNIKSGKKLREQFDTLTAQRSTVAPKVNIRTRALEMFATGKVFFVFNDTQNNRSVHVCLWGDHGALYDYNRNVYVPKQEAEKMWGYIDKHFATIMSDFKAKQKVII